MRDFTPPAGSVFDPLVTRQALAAIRIVGADPAPLGDGESLARLHRNLSDLLTATWRPGRSGLFVDLHVGGRPPRSIELHIGIVALGGVDAAREAEDTARVALAAFGRSPSVYAVDPVDPLHLVGANVAHRYATRIEQTSVCVTGASEAVEVPCRWDRAASDWLALCDLLLSRPGEIRFRTCAHATTLGLRHEQELARLGDTLETILSEGGDPTQLRRAERGLKTVAELRDSLGTPLFVGEAVLCSPEPLSETLVRAVASELTGELDVVHVPELPGMSTPTTSVRTRFAGGFRTQEIDGRTSEALLRGLPTASVIGPDLADLWTLTETNLAVRLPAPAGRPIPTIAARSRQELRAPTGVATSGARIGTDPAGAPVHLDQSARSNHVHLIGTSGVGKSTVMLRMIEADAAEGLFFFLLDPHGDAATQAEEIARAAGRTVAVVDITRKDSTPLATVTGLHLRGEARRRHVDRCVGVILGAITSHLPIEFAGPRFGRVAGAALTAVIHALPGGRLRDVSRLLDDRSSFELLMASSEVPDDARNALENEMRSRDAADVCSWVASKFDDLTRPHEIDRILAPFGEGLDLVTAMRGGTPVIVNLAKGELGAYETHRIGQLVLALAAEAAFQRRPDDRRPARIYVDEIHSFPAPNLRRLFDEARKFQVSLVVAHQTLGQLPHDLAASILGNPQTRAVFRTTLADAHTLGPMLDVPARHLTTQPNHAAVLQTTCDGHPLPPFTVRLDPPKALTSQTAAARDSRLKRGARAAQPQPTSDGPEQAEPAATGPAGLHPPPRLF